MTSNNVTSISRVNLYKLYTDLKLLHGAVTGLSGVAPHIPECTDFQLLLEHVDSSFYSSMQYLEDSLSDDWFTSNSPRHYEDLSDPRPFVRR